MGNKHNPPFRGTLAPLAIRDFRRLLIGNALWWQAIAIDHILIGWLVLELTDSAWKVALVGFYRSLPLLIFGFISSLAADRFGRKSVILCSQALNIFVFSGFILLLWSGHLTFWHIAVGEFLVGVGWAHEWPARRAIIPDLVGRTGTLDGLVVENVTSNVSKVLGPMIGGILIAAFGMLGCLVFTMGIFVAGFFVMLSLSAGSKRPGGRIGSPWKKFTEGMAFIRGNQPIMGVILITLLMNLFIFPYMPLLPVFARDILGQGPVGLGVLGGAAGIGTFFGLLLVTWLKRFRRNGWVYVGGCLLKSAAILAFAASTSYPLSVALLIISGVGQAAFGVMQTAIILVSSTDEMRDRAMGMNVMAIGAAPIGRLQIGAMAGAWGAPGAVAISGVAGLLSISFIAALLPGLRAKDDSLRQQP